MSGRLGAQTATVVERERQRHNEYRDGTRTDTPGCSLQPDATPTESTDREQRSELRYKLFAPPGFRARAQDEVEVAPGPVNDDGTPARLDPVGPAEPWLDQHGAERHVLVRLRRRLG